MDGISVRIRHIKVIARSRLKKQNCANPGSHQNRLPNLFIDISRLDVYSTNKEWKVKDLQHCLYYTSDKKNVFVHKVNNS